MFEHPNLILILFFYFWIIQGGEWEWQHCSTTSRWEALGWTCYYYCRGMSLPPPSYIMDLRVRREISLPCSQVELSFWAMKNSIQRLHSLHFPIIKQPTNNFQLLVPLDGLLSQGTILTCIGRFGFWISTHLFFFFDQTLDFV